MPYSDRARQEFNEATPSQRLEFAVGKNLWLYKVQDVVASSTANGLQIDNLKPLTYEDYYNACELAGEILEPLSERFSERAIVNSWFRCRALNNKLPGAAATSDHLTAKASDIKFELTSTRKLFNFLFSSKLKIDQLIWEYDGKWVHVSHEPFPQLGAKRQVFGINRRGRYSISLPLKEE
jgi:hypothetical protein